MGLMANSFLGNVMSLASIGVNGMARAFRQDLDDGTSSLLSVETHLDYVSKLPIDQCRDLANRGDVLICGAHSPLVQSCPPLNQGKSE
jgi:hypothetical protein